MAKTTRKAGATGSINITELVLKQPNRSNVDIKKWRTAIQSAESTISPRRKDLYDLYFDLILDGHLISVMEKRQRAVKSLPVIFTKDGAPVDQVNEFLDTKAFRDMLSDLNDSKFWGHTLVQLDFTGEKLTYELIPRKHVKPEIGVVTLSESDMSGVDFRSEPEFNYILEAGGRKNLGKLMAAAQYVIWKRGGFGDWAELAELFGRPLRKGKYNPNDNEGKSALISMLEKLGGAPYIAYPEGTDVQVDASGSNLTGDIYEKLKDACNAEMSKIFVGSTLTTEQGQKGARSLGEVHERGEHDVFTDDRLDIISLLNNEFKRLLELHGFPVTGGKFTYQDTEELSRKVQLDMVKIIRNDLSVPVSDDYIYETFDIPKPDNYDELKTQATEAKKILIQQPAPAPQPEPNPEAAKTPEPPVKGIKKPTPGKKATALFIDRITGFFTSLMGKVDPIEEFSAKAQTEARRIAKMIYDGTLPDGFTVDEVMVNLIAEYLTKAIEDGYGEIAGYEMGSSRRALGEKLIRSAYKFSAAKTEAMQKDMVSMMTGADGEPLSFANFKKVVDSLNIQYNKNWMQTEWNTSTSSAMMAEKWAGFTDDSDVMPYLEYVTTKDERVRAEHAALDGVIRPVNDSFWDTYYPPNDWGCRCDVMQVTNPDAKPTDVSAMSLPVVPDQFANNPGKTGEIFNNENPIMKTASPETLSQGEKMADDYLKGLK